MHLITLICQSNWEYMKLNTFEKNNVIVLASYWQNQQYIWKYLITFQRYWPNSGLQVLNSLLYQIMYVCCYACVKSSSLYTLLKLFVLYCIYWRHWRFVEHYFCKKCPLHDLLSLANEESLANLTCLSSKNTHWNSL